jgi:hypothetical protein
MLGWVIEVEAALDCAGEGHMRFPKVAAPAQSRSRLAAAC